jgi:hypothetical protein
MASPSGPPDSALPALTALTRRSTSPLWRMLLHPRPEIFGALSPSTAPQGEVGGIGEVRECDGSAEQSDCLEVSGIAERAEIPGQRAQAAASSVPLPNVEMSSGVAERSAAP